jgi:CHAT domain-containing protein/tetratricopeptide (TPR) repeat protein
MKSILLMLALMLVCGRGFAQNVDSLRVAKEVDSLIGDSRGAAQKRNFDMAIQINEQAEKKALNSFGQHSAQYGLCCHNRGTINYTKGDYPEAEKWLLEAKSIREKVLGKQNQDYAKTLNNLGLTYQAKGEYANAEQMYAEAKNIWEKTLGKEHPGYPNFINNLALLYLSKGEYDKAEPLYIEANEIRAKTTGVESLQYASSANNLAYLYHAKGDYNRAEPLYIQAKSIRAKILGQEHPEYGSSLITLAIFYKDKGDYTQAESINLRAKEIISLNLGAESLDYANVLNNLAVIYEEKGDYAQAELFYSETQRIRAKKLGKNHPDYGRSLNNLARVYDAKGDFVQAEKLFLEAIEILAKSLGTKHPDYAATINNLAIMYRRKRNYTKAETLYIEAKDIRAQTIGKEHPDYAISLNNLGNLYYEQGYYEKAKGFHLEAKDIRAKSLGKEHPMYAMSLQNLARIYQAQGDFNQARLLFREAKEIRAKVLGIEHPFYATSLYSNAMLSVETNHIIEAEPLLIELTNLNIHLLEKAAAYSSESQMQAYLLTFEERLSQFHSFAQTYPNPDLTRATYDNALFYNGYLLDNARHLAISIDKADSLTRETYYNWQAARRRLANEYSKPIADRKYVSEVEAEAEAYEKTLTRSVAAFGETRRTPHWQDVQARLRTGEAAVEFIHYQYYTPKSTDSIMYAALILRPGMGTPQLIPLFEEKQLSALLSAKQTSGTVNNLYAFDGKGYDLYQLLWKPLVKALDGATTVYFAPSGLLYRLNISAIPVSGDARLADRYSLVKLGSTRQLIAPAVFTPKKNDAILFGGIRYEMDSTAINQANAALPKDGSIAMRGDLNFEETDSTLRGSSNWPYLEGTEKEVVALEKTLQTAGIESYTRKAYTATEEAFKRIGAGGVLSPRVLHIATHGFFYPDPKDTTRRQTFGEREPVFRISDNPLIRSGLIMAGANQAWQTGKPLKPSMDDGILTAYEISQMDLSGTELVVLSACETGLGDIQGNEGVYGLQRAFKIAGARYLIMSLWKVSDEKTALLMTKFYEKWLVGKMPIPEAFRAAQKEMQETPGINPFDWAGFVLVE